MDYGVYSRHSACLRTISACCQIQSTPRIGTHPTCKGRTFCRHHQILSTFFIFYSHIIKIIQYLIKSSVIFSYPIEKTQQKVVDFFIQSRKRKRVRSRHFCSISLLFDNGNCHMWHLRFSDIANDTITYGT